MADILTQTSSDLENGVSVVAALGDDGVVRILITNLKYRLDRTTPVTITLPASISDDTPLTTYLIDADHSNWFDTAGTTNYLDIVDSPSIVAGTVTVELPPRSVYLLVFAHEGPNPPPIIPATVRYYTVTASRAELGFNVSDDALLATAAAYGANAVRVQFGWDSVEDYATGDLALSPGAQDFLDACVVEDLKPIVLAAYGPPWTQLTTLTVTSDVAVGATTIEVNEDPSGIDPPYCFVHSLTGRISPLADNYGSLITAVDTGPNTITLASATNVPLSAGQQLVVIRRRYPPPQTSDPTDASILAYVRYAEFLAQEIADRSLEGWVEIWNEPTWSSDRWEGIGNYYDIPGALPTGWPSLANFLLALQTTPVVTGVKYVNGTANLSWSGSMKALGIYDYSSPATDFLTLWGDSIHPYNGPPEYAGVYWGGCSTFNLDPFWSDSNYRGIPEDDCFWQQAHPGETGPLAMATETNTGVFPADETGWRWIRRRVASLWAMAVSPASIYDLTDNAADPFDVVTSGRGAALAPMMAAIAALGGDGTDVSVPTISNVGMGDWDIMFLNIYGADGCVTLLWQRTSAAGATAWGLVPTPDPVEVTLTPADGYTYSSAVYLETGDPVPRDDYVFPVTDDLLMIVSTVDVGAPQNVEPPEVTGTTAVGNVLVSSTGEWTNNPTSYTYQWQSSPDGITWSDVVGETDPEYVLVDSDIGLYYRVGVVAANADGPSTVSYSEAVGPVTAVPSPSEDAMAPCTQWITGDDVADCCNVETTSGLIFDAAAEQASDLLFSISGRLFAGECSRTVRPSCSSCWCGYQILSRGHIIGPWSVGYPLDLCDSCLVACEPSLIKLAGVPIRAITEVKIDGDVVDTDQYRIFNDRYLQRLDGGRWPISQNLTLPDTEDHTFSISYTFGADPPPLGRAAAASIGCEICKAWDATSGACALPTGVTRITRQGITIDRLAFTSWGFRDGRWATGLPLVDAFLASVNPAGLQRRPTFWAPGHRPYAQPWG